MLYLLNYEGFTLDEAFKITLPMAVQYIEIYTILVRTYIYTYTYSRPYTSQDLIKIDWSPR
jgi:hypothetical protein